MKIKRINRLITKKIDEEFIVFDTEKSLVYELNPTAEIIWKLLRKEKTVDGLIDEIVMKFNINRVTVNKDIQTFIKKYQNKLFKITE